MVSRIVLLISGTVRRALLGLIMKVGKCRDDVIFPIICKKKR